MSRYSEKLERRREEAAREAQRNEKEACHARHAAVAARAASPEQLGARRPANEFGVPSDVPKGLVMDLASTLDCFDVALTDADELVELSVNGLAKSEALSIRNSLWAMREKLRGIHQRATRFYVITKAEVSNA